MIQGRPGAKIGPTLSSTQRSRLAPRLVRPPARARKPAGRQGPSAPVRDMATRVQAGPTSKSWVTRSPPEAPLPSARSRPSVASEKIDPGAPPGMATVGPGPGGWVPTCRRSRAGPVQVHSAGAGAHAYCPGRLTAHAYCRPFCTKSRERRPSVPLHSYTAPSAPHVTSSESSGDHQTVDTRPVWPLRTTHARRGRRVRPCPAYHKLLVSPPYS